jgi:hypothetical protein
MSWCHAYTLSLIIQISLVLRRIKKKIHSLSKFRIVYSQAFWGDRVLFTTTSNEKSFAELICNGREREKHGDYSLTLDLPYRYVIFHLYHTQSIDTAVYTAEWGKFIRAEFNYNCCRLLKGPVLSKEDLISRINVDPRGAETLARWGRTY